MPAEYYKTFEDVLFEPYKKPLEHIERNAEIPESWKAATITSILKIWMPKK